MSLGFARDSILNLQQLGEGFGIEADAHEVGDGDDDVGMILDDDDEDEEPPKSSLIPFPASAPAPSPERSNVVQNMASGARVTSDQPQHFKEEQAEAPKTVTNQYAGFASDYAEYSSYYESDPYAAGYGYGGYGMQQGQASGKKNIFCCLFAPWNANKEVGPPSDEESNTREDEEQETQVPSANSTVPELVPPVVSYDLSREEEKKAEENVTEHQLPKKSVGQKASEYVARGASEEKVDELANTNLPVVPTPVDTADEEEKEEPLPPKGILKKCKMSLHKSASVDASRRDDSSVASGDNRRHMFPSYSRETTNDEDKESKKLSFAPMARVVTVTSRKDLAFLQKSQIWWQRTDYDDFKKTGRIIAKAMLQGGSEIWLTSNDAWGKKRSQSSQQATATNANDENGNEDEQDTEYERALHKYIGGLQQEAGEQPRESESSFGNKWWCKFGHSRRGLEHIASMEEGRQRQRNVNTATKAVMDEQRRQRMNRTKDAFKLATIAHQYTSWARDLSLAAAAADREAVRVNFKSDAKCRSHYLVTGVNAKQSVPFTDSQKYSFISGHLAAELLDANTSSSMKTKREEEKGIVGTRSTSLREDAPTPPLEDEAEEAIHESNAPKDNMARKAAGFAANDGEKVNISAVLSGMGSVVVQG